MSFVDNKYSKLFNFVMPAGFAADGVTCPDERMSKQEIEELIDLAKADFLKCKSKLKIEFSEADITANLILIASCAKGISILTKSLLDSFEGTGRALDIGCGIGRNSVALLSKGWSVYALDKQSEVLEIFKDLLSKSKPSGKCVIVNKDITKTRLKSCDLDLVLADDVLAYLKPDSLIPTISKIHEALMPGGIFMGSFLVNRKLETENDFISMGQILAMNSYSYTNPAIVPNILRQAGFHIEVCSLSNLFLDLSHPSRMVCFVARKLPMSCLTEQKS